MCSSDLDELCDRIALIHGGRIVDVGAPAELKAKLGLDATLDDVFANLTGASIDNGGSYRDVRRFRRAVGKLK